MVKLFTKFRDLGEVLRIIYKQSLLLIQKFHLLIVFPVADVAPIGFRRCLFKVETLLSQLLLSLDFKSVKFDFKMKLNDHKLILPIKVSKIFSWRKAEIEKICRDSMIADLLIIYMLN